MEAIHTTGIWMAHYLQQQTAYFVCSRLGVAVLWVSALSEWLNLMLKWVLFGDRPYWWVGESRVYFSTKPKISQFPCTCETGPGSPSGHSMVTAAVWWVVVPPLSSFLHSRTHCWVISTAPYVIYALLLGAVGTSRIFILAHFPHQVVTGIITGIFLGIFLSRPLPEGHPLLFFVSFSAGMLFSALILNVALRLVGIDLLWTVALAKKWCSRAEWIRMDTFPFSSLARDCGSLVGLGLAQYWKQGKWCLSFKHRALSLVVSSIGLYLLCSLPLPHKSEGLYYCLVFVKFTLVPLIVIVLSPGLAHFFIRRRKKD
ncbi:glucose-6-phosphatase 3 isoform X2 [Poeciliopsis prolifica]|uniref:glucose-6-phosphatase 3 isoform X2 n=1 Tax=Poeciliopsis prolifica TaxID=188132 RepID=UPI0024131142|nr:glucose-6-phosphatase 3 isoform X2 [Poeciliopsis prolifica]